MLSTHFIQEENRRVGNELYSNRKTLLLLERQTTTIIGPHLEILHIRQLEHIQSLLDKFLNAFCGHSWIIFVKTKSGREINCFANGKLRTLHVKLLDVSCAATKRFLLLQMTIQSDFAFNHTGGFAQSYMNVVGNTLSWRVLLRERNARSATQLVEIVLPSTSN